MGEKYIIKWQVQDISGKWNYRYLGGFTFTGDYLDYDAMHYIEGAVRYPEGVANWLCELLELEGKHPEMERVA